MLCFSVAIKLNRSIAEKELLDISQTASFACRRFCEQSENSDCVFITAATENRINCIAMFSNESLKKQTVMEPVGTFLRMLSIENDEIGINEITCFAASRKLHSAVKNGFVIDGDTVLNELNIRWIEKNYMIEKLIPTYSNKEEMLKRAASLFNTPSLMDELERIDQKSIAVPYCGHPVHYIIEVDCQDLHLQVTKLLLSALYANQRIRSRRYAIKTYASVEPINDFRLRDVYESCEGGTCVIDYVSGDRGHEDPGPPDESDLDMICSAIKKFKHSVLTIICVAPIQKDVRDYIMKQIPYFVLIRNTKDGLDRQGAASYLKNLAEETNASPDDSLMYGITSDRDNYKIPELQEHFDKWYDDYLKRVAYPQYASMTQASDLPLNKQCIIQQNAYDQLQEMIGLNEAKSFIDQLLNYGKAQNLFKSKGIAMDQVAMHMVFTGNPGTAKTTVARLFAQIMKDNGLLSVGNLLEVGRADLVGKYVGWTAQLVKDKFKAAKGSVLFIDEAYSLVDDRDGMYGDEAINTIVQEMENHRDSVVVIFAGYPLKMENFLRKNPGLRSRIGFQIGFPDYSSSELFQILELITKGSQMKLAADVREKLLSVFESARKAENYGNGRFVRNFYEKAHLRQVSRLMAGDIEMMTNEEVTTMREEDFDLSGDVLQVPSQRVIGFGTSN